MDMKSCMCGLSNSNWTGDVIAICDHFAAEFDLKFNNTKSVP